MCGLIGGCVRWMTEILPSGATLGALVAIQGDIQTLADAKAYFAHGSHQFLDGLLKIGRDPVLPHEDRRAHGALRNDGQNFRSDIGILWEVLLRSLQQKSRDLAPAAAQ